MNFIEYPDRDFLFVRAAGVLTSALRSALGQSERVSFAVPGGTTPGPIFDTLSGIELDWSRVDILPTDERWVSEDSEHSNARLIRRRLLTGKAAAASFHSLWRDTPRPEDALKEVTQAIAPLLPLQLVLLGMGEDMHCASMFPHGDTLEQALDADAPPLLPARRSGDPDAEMRITLTMPVLADAMGVHLLITGTAKREALMRAEKLSPTEAPIAGVLANATVHWAE